jgi:hypothetical protein
VWFVSLSSIRLDEMTDIGIASVLPATTWIGMGLVTAGFAVAWRIGSTPLMAVGVLVTILVLHGLGVLAEPTMRFASAWQHVGITDYIAEHGRVDPNIDAYFNWPGFFILGAFLTSTMGLDNIEPVARAAPLFYNVLYLLPLVAIGRALVADRRMVWLGVWLFYAFSWIGQDYFSPQGLAFFLYLVVLAVMLQWFKGIPRTGRLRDRVAGRAAFVVDRPSTTSQRALLIAGMAVVALAIVGSHQLTPFALITTTAVLAFVGWDRLRLIPVAFLLMTLGWASYLAVTYLAGHFDEVTGSVGALNSTVSVGVGGRLRGSAGHEAIVHLRLATMGVLWGLALFGFARRAWRRELSLGLLALALAPFLLVAMQSYGGEVLLRIALFSLPFMAFSIALLFARSDGSSAMSPVALVALVGLAVVALAAFPLNRYGNERMDYYPRGELAATDALYRIAPEGSALFAASWSLPWRYRHYADYYYYSSLTDKPGLDYDEPDAHKLAEQVATRMRDADERHAFLIIAKSTAAQSDLFGPWKPGAQERLRRILTASPLFRVRYQNAAAAVFQVR